MFKDGGGCFGSCNVGRGICMEKFPEHALIKVQEGSGGSTYLAKA